MTLPFASVMETMVLLKVAAMFAMPEVMFFEPLALRTLTARSSSLRRSSAVTAFGTPPTSSTGLASAAGAAASPPAAGFAAFGALAGLTSAAGAAAPSAAGAFLGFSFLGADFSSDMEMVIGD